MIYILKNKKIRFLVLISFILLLSGCQQVQKPLYVWNDYFEVSTDYGINGENKKYTKKYMSTLKKIIDESKKNKQRVAPGIYAEYAEVLFKTNHKKEAKQYFLLEKKIYPESSKFIDSIITKLYGDVK